MIEEIIKIIVIGILITVFGMIFLSIGKYVINKIRKE